MTIHSLQTNRRLSSPSTPSNPLRIALFSGNYDCVRDGANQALNRLVGHLLATRQAEVRIYAPRAPQAAFKAVGDVRSVPSLSFPGRPEYRLALGFSQAARRDFDAFAPQVVHLSAPDILGRQAQKYARAAGIPVIASLHTRFESYPDYYRMPFLRRPIANYLDRFYGDCDHVLAPTRPIADELAEKHGGDRVSIWGRGVDRALFNPDLRSAERRTELGYAAGEIVPLFFGRLVMEKGLAVFADVIAALRSAGHAVRPLIVGEGPARGWLERHLPGAVLTGHLEGAELGSTIASADILINPSLTEAFGNVNLEAMASGLAVVSANVPSAASLIRHGHNGLLVAPDDVQAFARAVQSLIRDGDRRRAVGLMAGSDAARHRWGEILGTVFDTYRDLVQGGPLRQAA